MNTAPKIQTVTPATMTAIGGSIDKWQKIVTAFEVGKKRRMRPEYQEDSIHDCPLCQMFHTWNKFLMCNGCPIKEDTGEIGCDGTPYEVWSYGSGSRFNGEFVDGAHQENAEAMLEYLQGLETRCVVKSSVILPI